MKAKDLRQGMWVVIAGALYSVEEIEPTTKARAKLAYFSEGKLRLTKYIDCAMMEKASDNAMYAHSAGSRDGILDRVRKEAEELAAEAAARQTHISMEAIFLWQGFEAVRGSGDYPDTGGGQLTLVEAVAEHAPAVWGFMESRPAEDGWPGVFSYEITEEMGGWLYSNIGANPEEFLQELTAKFNMWIAEGGD